MMRVLFCLSALYNGMGLSSLVNGSMVRSCCQFFFFLMKGFRDSRPNSGISGLHVRVWPRIEETEVSKHCCGTFGIGILENSLEMALLHGHCHSQGQQLLKGRPKHLRDAWHREGEHVSAAVDISVHGHA